MELTTTRSLLGLSWWDGNHRGAARDSVVGGTGERTQLRREPWWGINLDLQHLDMLENRKWPKKKDLAFSNKYLQLDDCSSRLWVTSRVGLGALNKEGDEECLPMQYISRDSLESRSGEVEKQSLHSGWWSIYPPSRRIFFNQLACDEIRHFKSPLDEISPLKPGFW